MRPELSIRGKKYACGRGTLLMVYIGQVILIEPIKFVNPALLPAKV